MARVKKQTTITEDASNPEIVEGTEAADTLRPGSRSAMMMQVIQRLDGMGVEDLSHFLNDTLAQIGSEAATIPNDAAKKNAASVAMKGAVKEDLEILFGGSEELSEEFKENLQTIFESAVNARVTIEVAEKVEEITDAVDQYLEEKTAELVEHVDQYTSYLTEKFFEKNQLAIDKSLNAEIAESFMADLHELFNKHNITVPDGKTDVVEELAKQVEELQEKLNEAAEENMELHALMEESKAIAVFESATEGLTATQSEKLKELCEGLEYETIDQLQKKINTIKEAHFASKAVKPSSKGGSRYEDELLSESVNDDEPKIHPTVSSVLKSIARRS